VAPRDEDIECIDRCVEELRKMLPRLGGASDWKLSIFGSAANGFSVRDSDVDVTCISAAKLLRHHRFTSDMSELLDKEKEKEKAKEKEEREEKKEEKKQEKDEKNSEETEETKHEEDNETRIEEKAEKEEAEEKAEKEEKDEKDEKEEKEAHEKKDNNNCEKEDSVGEKKEEDSAGDDEQQLAEEPQAVLRGRWQPMLEEHLQFKVVEEIFFAKVPILKVQFDGRLEVDLSCQNTRAVQNTKLLRAYANMDPRVRELVIAVKLWAKAAHVCGAAKHHLSSYSFTLLTIYFLQVSVDVQLPCLPVAAFEPDGAGEDDKQVKAATAGWVLRLSTAELLINFFLFYNFCFAWGREVVSMRLGTRHIIEEQPFEALQGRWSARMHIEDPYIVHRNLHCVLGCEEELQLRTAFAEAMHGLSFGLLPRGLEPASPAEVDDVITAPHHGIKTSGSGAADVTTTSCDDGAGASGGEVSSFSEEDDERINKGFPWWKNMSSDRVLEAVHQVPAVSAPRSRLFSNQDLETAIRSQIQGEQQPRCLTVQDLEGRIGEQTRAPKSMVGITFSSNLTRGIAARVNRVCARSMEPAVQLQ